MSNQVLHILTQWHPERDNTDWVLGTVTEIKGSSYRKPGAMMLFSGLGQQIGLLSGGCLELDLMRHARQVIEEDSPKTIVYDMQDEDSIAWQLGIGCGGIIKIQLNQINRANTYLQLDLLYEMLTSSKKAWFELMLSRDSKQEFGRVINIPENILSISPSAPLNKAYKLIKGDAEHLIIPITPPPHLLVFGGGVDARPLVNIAHELGWQVTLIDSRPSYARAVYFPKRHAFLIVVPKKLNVHY